MPVELQELINTALLTVGGALVNALVALVVWWLNTKRIELRKRIDADSLAQLDYWAGFFVKALEQSKLKENLELTGEQMFNTAVDQLQQKANQLGLKWVSVEDLGAIIRAALRDGIHKGIDIPVVELTEEYSG